ncbi:MAG TPA: hypothetical protein VN651_01820 [Gemmatimonadaceae bacterium]|nr:hypothetical protein [Gemmatimonadaceae bacterium]
MRRRIASLAGLLSAAAIIISCGDNARRTFPTGPLQPAARSLDLTPGACTTLSALQSLASAVFGAGSPNAQSALGKLSNMDALLQQGKLSSAQSQAQNIVTFVQQKAAQGTLPGSHDQIEAFISGVLCYVGLSPDTFLILPSDNAQVFKNGAGNAGLSLQANTVTVPTLVTITVLPPTTPPLDTKLDQYPGFIELTQSSVLTKPAVVAVCPASSISPEVLGRLRLGHQATTGFEITPAADAGFLDCSTSTAQSRLPEWLQRLASIVLPTPLYAKPPLSGGIGGLASEFSPFAPVDPVVSFAGGVGGTATEFQRRPSGDSLRFPSSASTPSNGSPSSPTFSRTPGPRLADVVNGVCTQIDAVVGTPVETECRPKITLTTFQGTILTNVPVGWAIGLGGGTIAPNVTTASTCGAFGSTAATTTDANGQASVCWTLGTTPATNTVLATPTSGGDAPAGVTFSPAGITFTATANQLTPTATATGGTFVYDGQPHPGSGTCSNNLTPALAYGGGSVPTNVGTYTLTVTCGAGNPIFVTVTQTATIQITAAPTTTSVVCPTSIAFTGAALTPCTASATGPGLSQSLVPAYSGNVNAGTATATASYPGGGNYLASGATASFQITAAVTTASVSCPASVTYTGNPITPCTGSVAGPGLAQSLTPTYSSNVVGLATATVSYPGGGNYQSSSTTKTFRILYVQSGCFASPVYSVMPSTKSFQNKGSNLPVKCTLQNAQGSGVTNAQGSLLVEDLGTDGRAIPTMVVSIPNAFASSSSGNYSYGLDTSPAGFVSGHFYRITATWTDGSNTIGFFFIK